MYTSKYKSANKKTKKIYTKIESGSKRNEYKLSSGSSNREEK